MKFKKMKNTLDDFFQSLKFTIEYFRSKKIEKYSSFLVFIFVLSIADAVFTVTWLNSGLATEANPLLEELLKSGNFSFVATKALMTFLGCYILYRVKEHSVYAKSVILCLLSMYVLLTFYHIFGALVSIDESYLPVWISEFLIWVS